jgi:hypothetical protein
MSSIFQMSKLYSYNMDEKKINQFDLEASMGYKINEVNFTYNLILSNFSTTVLNGYVTACFFVWNVKITQMLLVTIIFKHVNGTYWTFI